MKLRALLLLGTTLVVGVLFSACSLFSVPERSVDSLKTALTSAAPSDPLGLGNKPRPAAKTNGKEGLKSVADAQEELATAKRRYAEGVTELTLLKATVKEKEAAAKAASERAIANGIIHTGWIVFIAGIVGAVIGVICVAKEYGTGGYWAFFGGVGVSTIGLCLVWIGPHWLVIARYLLAIFGIAMGGGIWYGIKHGTFKKIEQIKADHLQTELAKLGELKTEAEKLLQ